jgi:DNA polymerase-3 subunit epsilon
MNSLDIDSRPLVVLDVETTGLYVSYGDRICEVGLVVVQEDKIVETFQSLVNPQCPISPGAGRVNGIRDEDVSQAPLFAEIANQVLKRVDGSILVCHNAPFDLSFLDAELRRLDIPWQPDGVIDTLEIARNYFSFPSNSLGNLAADLGIETPESHRALGDALTTFQLYCYFAQQLTTQGLSPNDLLADFVPAQRLESEANLPPAIREALANKMPLEIVYVDRAGNETCRLITPRHILREHDYVYLVAYCHLREGERHFRLDRILRFNP